MGIQSILIVLGFLLFGIIFAALIFKLALWTYVFVRVKKADRDWRRQVEKEKAELVQQRKEFEEWKAQVWDKAVKKNEDS